MAKLYVRVFTFIALFFSLTAEASSINWARVWENELRTNLPKMQPAVDPGVQLAVLKVYEKLNWQPQYVFWEDQHKINKLLEIPAMAAKHGLNPNDYPIADILRIENDSVREIEVVIELILMSLDLSIGRVNAAEMNAEHVKFNRKNGLSKFRIEAIARLLQNPSQNILDDLAPRYEDYLLLQRALASGRYQGIERQKIILSMEKLRWLPDVPPHANRYLLVNSAANIMQNYDFNLPSHLAADIRKQRVITGNFRDGYYTPSMEDSITQIIINPYWRVPTAGGSWKEITTKIKSLISSGGVEAAKNYMTATRKEVTDTSFRNVMPLEAIDWESVVTNSSSQRFTYRQKPWDGNATGVIKFALGGIGRDNLIYLHDTGGRHLFNNSAENRHLSHGCVRVHKYPQLAEYLLSDSGYTANEIARLTNLPESERKEKWENLNADKEQMPVFVLHMTAQVEDGVVKFHNDAYKEDAELLQLLNRKQRRL